MWENNSESTSVMKKISFLELIKMINKRRSFIIGIKTTKLSQNEINFLKKYKPWGIILFSRNIKSIKQTQKLTSHIKRIFKDNNYPILVDEEGGRSGWSRFIASTTRLSTPPLPTATTISSTRVCASQPHSPNHCSLAQRARGHDRH